MSQIIDALQWRYAVKKFDATRTLTAQQIDTLTEAFNLTATSFGLQPVKLVVVADRRFRESVLKHSMNQQQVVDASHLLVFCIETTLDTAFVNAYFDRVKEIRDTSDEILKGYKDYLTNLFTTDTEEQKALWAIKQAYLTMGNVLTACALEKIDACPMEGFDPKGYDEALGLSEKGLRSVLVMPVGYRAEDDMFADFKKVRKPLAETVLHF